MSRTSPGVTVALGALVSVAALVVPTVVILSTHPGSTARFIIVAVALVAGAVGGVMMLKDLTP